MNIDPKEFKRGLDDTLMKQAGLFDDVGAAYKGMQLNTQNIGYGDRLRSPFQFMGKAYEGAKAGFAGKVMNEQTAGLQQQGLTFQKDQFGVPQKVDIGATIKNYAGNLFGGGTGAQPGSGAGFLQNAGNFINNHKGALLGGLGVAAGGWALKNMLFPAKTIRPRYGMPRPYMYQPMPMGMMAPQALQKAGGVLPMPSPLSIPSAAASAATGQFNFNDFGFPGVGQPKSEEPQAPGPQQDYAPRLTTDNPDLKNLLQDERMRSYLTNLIKQVDASKGNSNF